VRIIRDSAAPPRVIRFENRSVKPEKRGCGLPSLNAARDHSGSRAPSLACAAFCLCVAACAASFPNRTTRGASGVHE
jgi:hypothetical protein